MWYIWEMETVARPQYARRHPRSGMWEFFRTVPPDLRPIVGKTMVRKSLGGRDWTADVEQVFYTTASQVAAQFERAREKLNGKDEQNLYDLAIQFLRAEFPPPKPPPRGPGAVLNDPPPYPRWGFRDADELRSRLVAFLNQKGVQLAPMRFATALKAAHDEHDFIFRKDLRGEWVWQPTTVTPQVAVPTSEKRRDITLTQTFERYQVEKQLDPKMERQWALAVEQFTQVIGDLPVGEITKARVVEFKDAMVKMPRNLPHEWRHLTVPEVLQRLPQIKAAWEEKQKAESGKKRKKGDAVKKGTDADKPQPFPTLAPKTINDNKIGAISAVLQWAVGNAKLELNPARDVRVATNERRARREGGGNRLPFAEDQLVKLFTSGPYEKPDRISHHFWLPLLGYMTGGRLEEYAQLSVRDVVRDHRANWHLKIDDENGKRIKNEASRRWIPIHSELINLGFLQFVDTMRDRGDQRLFPELKPDKFGVLSTNYSKVFGRGLRKLGFGKRYVFHSFRHGFKDLCREAGIPKDVRDRIQGHTIDDDAEDYGEGHKPWSLAKQVAKLRFIDVSHLLRPR